MNTQLVAGFEIESTVSSTDESTVYQVNDKITCRKMIAKKCLTKHSTRNKKHIEILRRINHPHILTPELILEENDQTVLIMPLINGPDLYDALLKYHYRFTEKQVCNIVYQIVTAINYLHQSKIYHGDVKLENFMLKSNDIDNPYVYMIDFGHSNDFEIGSVHSGPIGTPNYNTPELVLYNQFNEKVDIWGVGLIAYALLICDFPFLTNGITMEKVKLNILTFKLEFPSHEDNDYMYEDLSEEAKDFITKALTKDPNQRASASELLEHPWLREFAGQAVELPPAPDIIDDRKLTHSSDDDEVQFF